MAPRTLFNVALKITGLFFIRNILEAFSRTLSVLVYFPQYASSDEGFYNLGVTIPPLVLYSLFSWMLIFRTESLINLFRLDKGLPAGEGLKVHRSVILGLAVIVTGGWILVNEIPEFFRHAIYYYQERKIYVRMARPDLSYLVMSGVKILIGLILVVFNGKIVRIIEIRRRDQVPWYWPINRLFRRRRKRR